MRDPQPARKTISDPGMVFKRDRSLWLSASIRQSWRISDQWEFWRPKWVQSWPPRTKGTTDPHIPNAIFPNSYRLYSIFSVVAMRTSTVLSFLRNQSPRRSCQFSISYKPSVDVWSRSSGQVAFLRQGSFTLTAWRYDGISIHWLRCFDIFVTNWCSWIRSTICALMANF